MKNSNLCTNPEKSKQQHNKKNHKQKIVYIAMNKAFRFDHFKKVNYPGEQPGIHFFHTIILDYLEIFCKKYKENIQM